MSIYKIAAISGSLRNNSCNKGLLRTCIALNNTRLNIEVLDISQIPLFNQDLEKQSKPDAVKYVFDRVKRSDGVLFSHPQHSQLMSACLKNTYDWLSRGGQNAAVYKKPMAQMVTGWEGTNFDVSNHLRQVVEYCKVPLMQEPRIKIIVNERGNFDENGNLVNDSVRNNISNFLECFALHIEKSKRS